MNEGILIGLIGLIALSLPLTIAAGNPWIMDWGNGMDMADGMNNGGMYGGMDMPQDECWAMHGGMHGGAMHGMNQCTAMMNQYHNSRMMNGHC